MAGVRVEEAQIGEPDECNTNEVRASDNLVGMVFNSRDEAWNYYRLYAKNKGFSVSRATTRTDGMGNVHTQEFCCSRGGQRRRKVNDSDRKRAPRDITRIGCKAKVIVKCKEESRWEIVVCHSEHNHPLCPPIMQPYLRSAREVNEDDVIEAQALKSVGLRTSEVMNYFTQQSGGFHNVGFIRKDLYNSLQKARTDEYRDGDVNSLLAYFDFKKDKDAGLSDYVCFGDVIAFDTTYKGNMYGRPIMPIVGVNHHHQTIIFGVAILADETADTFEWVLTEFMQAMSNKAPVSVVTDGDRGMHRAIKTVFPCAHHRICSWHLSRNAQANVGDPKFTSAFTRCMSSWWTIEEFDRQWRSVMKDFNVEQHPWVVEKDHTVGMWAQAYLTGHFFANLRSTQRCESMNSALNIILEHKKTYLEVVRAIDKGINDMRLNELNEEYKNCTSKPFPLTKLHDLEGSATDIFTRASFDKVVKELKNETLFRALHLILTTEGARTYRLTQYKDPDAIYEVVLDFTTHKITCSCRKFETICLPCRHQLHVLKLEDLSAIPNCLILPRWTKNAKVSAPSYLHSEVCPEIRQMSRFASLRSLSSRLCYLASQTDESFKTTKDELLRLTAQFEQSVTFNESSSHRVRQNTVRDPQTKDTKRKQKINTNASTKRRNHCSFCKMEGHNKNTCPGLKLQLPTGTMELDDQDMYEP